MPLTTTNICVSTTFYRISISDSFAFHILTNFPFIFCLFMSAPFWVVLTCDKAIAANILSYSMRLIERERTSTEVILYALYLYFLGLSLRSTSKAIQPFGEEGRSHVAVWKWVQRFNPKRLYHCKRVSAFLIDETMLRLTLTKRGYGSPAIEQIQYTNKFLDLHLKT